MATVDIQSNERGSLSMYTTFVTVIGPLVPGPKGLSNLMATMPSGHCGSRTR
jgi:hypothetical protein